MAFEVNVQLPVRQGRIACPAKRRRIDPAICLACTKLTSMTRDADDIKYVLCRPWVAGNARWSSAREPRT